MKKRSIKKKMSGHKKQLLGGIVLSLPSMLIVAIFFLLPMLFTLGLSFTDWNGIGLDGRFVGFSNYVDVISERFFWQILLNTLYLIILYVPIVNVLALVLAAILFNIRSRISVAYRSVIFFPNLLSPVVVSFIWIILYQYQNGIINKALRFCGLENLAQDWLGDKFLVMPSISLTIIWFAVGYFMVIYFAGLTTIPTELYEAARIEGAGRVQQFTKITVPMMMPSIKINVIFSTIGAFSSFEFTKVMTNGGPGFYSATLALQVFNYAYSNLQYGKSLAIAMVMATVAGLVTLIEWMLLRKKGNI